MLTILSRGPDMFQVRYELDASQRYQWRLDSQPARLPGQVTERNVYATVQHQRSRRLCAWPGRGLAPFTDANVIFARPASVARPGPAAGRGRAPAAAAA